MDPTNGQTLELDHHQGLRLAPPPPDLDHRVIVIAEEVAPQPTDHVRREAARWLTDLAR